MIVYIVDCNGKLKKCPFCGGEPVIIRHEYTGLKDTFGVKCNQCKSQGNQFYTELEDAIYMWNRRQNVLIL